MTSGGSEDPAFGGLRRMLCPSVDVPCRLLLSGLQVARVIGKSGILIKELREESGAIINILDKQLPVAFMNRDERVLFVRGSLEQIRVAISGILRLAFGGSSAAVPTEEEDVKRSVEMMLPEASCSHLIGEKGARISAIMDSTRCDLHVVREPVSGLADQKRVRITGPTIRDMELAVSKVQELLLDLTRFGALSEGHFDIKEGPTDPADLQPRERGRGGGLSVAMLLPKEEVAWVIGKRGSKISKLRERARVSVNDAEAPPFKPNHSIVEINGAPLSEEIHVLQLIVDDLMVRAEATNTTSLLLPTEHFGAAIGHGGEVITQIAERTGAMLNQLPAERHGGSLYHLRILEVTGSEGERIAAARAIYEVVEDARGPASEPPAAHSGGPLSSLERQPNARQLERADVPRVSQQVETARLPPGLASSDSGLVEQHRISEDDAGEEQRRIPDNDGGGVYTYSELRNAFTEYSNADLQAYWRDVCKVVIAKPAGPSQSTDRGSTSMSHSQHPSSGLQSTEIWDAAPLADAGESAWTALPAASSEAAASPPALLTSPVTPEISAGWAAAEPTPEAPVVVELLEKGTPAAAQKPEEDMWTSSNGSFPLFMLLPSMEVARSLANDELGIARRTGTQLTAGSAVTGEAMLRILGSPPANSAACYLVQEALWLNGAYSSASNLSDTSCSKAVWP